MCLEAVTGCAVYVIECLLSYEPADLTVQHPPPELLGVDSFFFVKVSNVPKNVHKKKPEYFVVI